MLGMEYAAAKASPGNSKPPTLASAASSIHSTKQPNGHSSTPQPVEVDDDPRGQLVETLRTQLTDTHNQLDLLNSKLVQSYDRVSTLEETLDGTTESLKSAQARIKELEAAKAEHEAALETGLLVEREHVANELSRLMERATEEAAQRGVADAARSRIETELDDLSADLFARANTMVAEARIARAASERKVEETEGALKSAEDAVKSMQLQMQQMVEARREAEAKIAEMRARMGKGKLTEGDGELEVDGPRRRLYNSHAIYREFVAFVSHLRGLRSNAAVMPQLPALTSLPFIARLIVEDCDPTLRLDLAPALNWLTRRAVHAAVLQGQLEIEPVYGLQEAECALCGSHPNGSLPSSATTSPTTATHVLSPRTHTPTGSGSVVAWASSTSKYFKGAIASPTTSPQAHTNQVTQSPLQRVIADPNAPPIYVFRIAGAQTNAGATPFVLCAGGWCLTRLRATCELCAFLKRGVIEKVWSEPPQPLHQGPVSSSISRDKDATHIKDKEFGDAAPPVPPRRRQLSQLGSLWEKGLGAFGGSRSGSRSGTPGPEEHKEIPPPQPERRLPPPPAPVDTKLSIVPPPPPPRARPVPPVPKPEGQETHEEDHEHQEPIHHAMVFDAAADEHGHHALSPTADKRHSIPITLHQPLRPILSPRSPTDTLATLPETVVSESAPPASEHAPESSPLAPTPGTQHLAPQAEVEPEEPNTPRPPPVSRPPRTRPIVHDGIPHRPMSPNGIPLPDSRPGTPAMSGRNVSPSRARTPSPTRFRAASPSIASPSSRVRAGSIRRDVESIRASSPAPSSPVGGGPPKIPRRAPRRAAPVPPGTPSKTERKAEDDEKPVEVEKKPEEPAKNPDVVETSVEPKAVAKEVKPETEEKAGEEDKPKVEDRPVPRPPPRRAVPPPPAPPLPARARPPQSAEHSEEAEGVEENKPGEAKPVIGHRTIESVSEQSAYTDGAPGVKENGPPVTTLITSATSDSVSHQASIPNTTEVNGMDVKRSTEADGQFVGDHSWEERAYKEIVKLREDMFWARIGSAW